MVRSPDVQTIQSAYGRPTAARTPRGQTIGERGWAPTGTRKKSAVPGAAAGRVCSRAGRAGRSRKTEGEGRITGGKAWSRTGKRAERYHRPLYICASEI